MKTVAIGVCLDCGNTLDRYGRCLDCGYFDNYQSIDQMSFWDKPDC